MATLIPLPFSGTNFFRDVRADMDGDRGLFFGKDGHLRYVCMDATFYRLEVFERPAASTFINTVKTFPSDVRVVTNGQFYDVHCEASPCSSQFEGEIVMAHTAKTGNPPSRPTYFHFGQWDGRTEKAFGSGRGDPSGVTPAFNNAIGGMLPLVQKGVRFGKKEERGPSGVIVQQSSPGVGSLDWKPGFFGWQTIGIHRPQQVLFALGQQQATWQDPAGFKLGEIIDRFIDTGVSDAVMCDSGTSSMLIVDQSVEVVPGGDRNISMPAGFRFRLQELQLVAGTAKLTRTGGGGYPAIAMGSVSTGCAGIVELTAGGSAVTLTSLGSIAGTPLKTTLGLTGNLVLSSSRSNLVRTPAASFQEPQSGSVATALLNLTGAGQSSDGKLTGTLTVPTPNVSGADAVFDVDWPLTV